MVSNIYIYIFKIFIPIPGDLVGGFEYFLFSSRSLGIWLVVSNIFYFHPHPLGEKIPNLTVAYFFKGVGEKPPTSVGWELRVSPIFFNMDKNHHP